MINILFWILFGILAGWISVILTDTRGLTRVLGNLAAGVIGALVGGAFMRLLDERGVTGLSLPGLLTATGGAIILLALVGRGNDKGRERRGRS